eukprot:UN03946
MHFDNLSRKLMLASLELLISMAFEFTILSMPYSDMHKFVILSKCCFVVTPFSKCRTDELFRFRNISSMSHTV